MSIFRTVGTMALIAWALSASAQVALVPEWERTWSYGQDPFPGMYLPPAEDNHVVVDPMTGLVHCSISDEDLLFSPRNELLFSFEPSGAEVTATQPPVLGKAFFPELYDHGFNVHSSFDLDVHNGIVVASHNYPMNDDQAPYNTGGAIDGSQWVWTVDLPMPGPRPASIAIGEEGVLLDGMDGITCTSVAGWYKWKQSVGAPIAALKVLDNVGWVHSVNGQLEKLSMADGSSLGSISLAPNARFMEIGGQSIHQAIPTGSSGFTVKKYDHSGALQFSSDHDLGTSASLSGLAVDGIGRTWVSATLLDIEDAALTGMLVGFDASGTLFGSYSYGASMNGVATNGQKLFITGRSDVASLGIYLIAVDTDFSTGGAQLSSVPSLHTWPNPATQVVNVQLAEPALSMSLVDATGHTVRSWPAAQAGIATMDVEGIAQGSYVLKVQAAIGSMSTALVITQ